jgi:hypothetical protein
MKGGVKLPFECCDQAETVSQGYDPCMVFLPLAGNCLRSYPCYLIHWLDTQSDEVEILSIFYVHILKYPLWCQTKSRPKSDSPSPAS